MPKTSPTSDKSTSPKFLLDVPENNALFGFDVYAKTLASAIKVTEPNFSIGIYGSWGTGKSTLLLQIQKLLDENPKETVVVNFDAWRYQHENNMLLPLLNTLSDELKSRGPAWKTVRAVLSDLAICVASSIDVKTPAVEIDFKKGIDTAKNFLRPERSLYYDWLNQLKKLFENIRKNDPEKRIVVMIDDLDRCVPNKLIEVLEYMKIMFGVPGFVFIVALDEQVLENAVLNKYPNNDKNFAKEYLKKLVQLTFRLPPLSKDDSKHYLDKLKQDVFKGDSALWRHLAEVLPFVASNNPREIKGFVNGVILGTSLLKNININTPIKNQIAFMALDFRWPNIVRAIESNDVLLSQFKNYKPTSSETEIDESNAVDHLLYENPGLEKFLTSEHGKSLFNLGKLHFSQLLFYTSMTKQIEQREGLKSVIDDALATLPEENRVVLVNRFGLADGRSKGTNEIAFILGKTESYVRKLESSSLLSLRQYARSGILQPYLNGPYSEEEALLYEAIFKQEDDTDKARQSY